MTIRRSRRSGFTLLEVLLASLIAILLLSALYFAMDITLRQTQVSREGVDVENLSRGVFTRINMDLSASLGPMPPKSGGNVSSSTSSDGSSTTGGTTSAMASTTGTTGMSGTTAMVTADPTATDPTAAPMSQPADIGFQAGIIGSDTQLTVFMSRLPEMMTSAQGLASPPDDMPRPSDLVRVTYWVSPNGGLCRQERPWVTADGVRDNAEPDLSSEDGDVLVPEVTSATFEYFDGTSWQSTWDGTQMSPDTVTPIGPPRAVRITLNYSFPLTKGGPAYEPTVVSVIPICAAPGIYTPAMIAASTDPGTTSPDSTTSGTSTGSTTTSGSTGSSGTGSTGGTTGGGSKGGASMGGGASSSTGSKGGGK